MCNAVCTQSSGRNRALSNATVANLSPLYAELMQAVSAELDQPHRILATGGYVPGTSDGVQHDIDGRSNNDSSSISGGRDVLGTHNQGHKHISGTMNAKTVAVDLATHELGFAARLTEDGTLPALLALMCQPDR